VTVERSHLEAQYQLAIDHDARAVVELRNLGAHVIQLDALLSPDEVEAAALQALGVA
jgi:hypothetical protein